MSLAILRSRALNGLSAPEVAVEVHLANGLPVFTLVGLPDTEVKEARDRVRAAITNSGFEFPSRRITVNLAPADLPKESGRFDLPIALGILIASGQIRAPQLDAHEFVGELSLSGELRAVHGALPMCLGAQGSERAFVLPASSANEAALLRSACILPAKSLLEVCAHLGGQQSITPASTQTPDNSTPVPDLADVRGQAPAKRALLIAAAGEHSVLFSGPPGTGKSMLAARLPGLLPPLTETQAINCAAIQSLVHGRFDPSHWGQRPFRAPHHTASAVALVGGGPLARPGEITLADNGVLFLDELPEFDRRVLEVMREPLESGRINIARAARRNEYPACFQLVAAMNPCPCGWHGHANGKCRCSSDVVARYRAKISGPILDRIDLHVEVPALPPDDLQGPPGGDTTATMKTAVIAARQRQKARQNKPNSRLSTAEIDQHCQPDENGKQMLRQAIDRLNLSARAYHRILRVARTVADLSCDDNIRREHIAESIQYRRSLS